MEIAFLSFVPRHDRLLDETTSAAATVRSTLRRLAFLADRAACFEFLDVIRSEGNLARTYQINGDLAEVA